MLIQNLNDDVPRDMLCKLITRSPLLLEETIPLRTWPCFVDLIIHEGLLKLLESIAFPFSLHGIQSGLQLISLSVRFKAC